MRLARNRIVQGYLDDGKTVLSSLIQSNEVLWAYLPVQLFGQAVGLNMRQIRLVQGIMRERTRTKAREKCYSSKPCLETVRNARVKAVLKGAEVTCPFLAPDMRYIAFGGNFKNRRGQGYQLVGRFHDDMQRHGGWLRRLGYPVTSQMEQTEEERIWKWTGIMLNDLAELTPLLELVVGAVDRGGEWHSLDELLVMVGDARHRHWLTKCSLRIFAPADHLVRWRRWFAQRLGFSFIAGGDWSSPQIFSDAAMTRPTALSIKARLFAAKIKGKQLAEHLGWVESRVSRQLNGLTALSDELIMAAQHLLS
jgi:hypothetical protein